MGMGKTRVYAARSRVERAIHDRKESPSLVHRKAFGLSIGATSSFQIRYDRFPAEALSVPIASPRKMKGKSLEILRSYRR